MAMKPGVRNLLIVALLFVLLGLVALWIRSYFATDSIGIDIGSNELIIASSMAHLSLWVGPREGSTSEKITFYTGQPHDLHEWSAMFSDCSQLLDFGFGPRRGRDTYTTLTVPIWFLLLLASFWPAMRIVRACIREYRRRRGYCPN
jgi:hypothetical protein